MESKDIVDDVNALLKLGVGDVYRLEHIKQSYIDNKTIWITDSNYLEKLREKYLTKPSPETLKEDDDDVEGIHCWKCGKKAPLHANFCMVCGSSIFEVGSEKQTIKETPKSAPSGKPKKLKIPILIGVPVLILIILGAAYGSGVFVQEPVTVAPINVPIEPPIDTPDTSDTIPDTLDSRCGPGTIYDDKSHSCILA